MQHPLEGAKERKDERKNKQREREKERERARCGLPVCLHTVGLTGIH